MRVAGQRVDAAWRTSRRVCPPRSSSARYLVVAGWMYKDGVVCLFSPPRFLAGGEHEDGQPRPAIADGYVHNEP